MISDLLGMEKSNGESRPYEALKAERKGFKNNNGHMYYKGINLLTILLEELRAIYLSLPFSLGLCFFAVRMALCIQSKARVMNNQIGRTLL